MHEKKLSSNCLCSQKMAQATYWCSRYYNNMSDTPFQKEQFRYLSSTNLIKIAPCCIDCDGCGVQSGGQRDQRTESPDAKEHHHHYQSAGYCI